MKVTDLPADVAAYCLKTLVEHYSDERHNLHHLAFALAACREKLVRMPGEVTIGQVDGLLSELQTQAEQTAQSELTPDKQEARLAHRRGVWKSVLRGWFTRFGRPGTAEPLAEVLERMLADLTEERLPVHERMGVMEYNEKRSSAKVVAVVKGHFDILPDTSVEGFVNLYKDAEKALDDALGILKHQVFVPVCHANLRRRIVTPFVQVDQELDEYYLSLKVVGIELQ